jgi:hypothetical protein
VSLGHSFSVPGCALEIAGSGSVAGLSADVVIALDVLIALARFFTRV